MTDQQIIRGIKENSPSVWRALYTQTKAGIRTQVAPLLRSVKDVEFDDIYNEGLV